MVSVSRIGQVFNTRTNFSANNVNKNKPADKNQLNKMAGSQVSMGTVVVMAGLSALAGSTIKKGIFKYIAPIPAAMICCSLGANMIAGGKAVKKALEGIENNKTNS